MVRLLKYVLTTYEISSKLAIFIRSAQRTHNNIEGAYLLFASGLIEGGPRPYLETGF